MAIGRRSQIEDEAKGRIDVAQVAESQMTDAVAEAGRVDCCGLFGQYAGHSSADLDLGSEARRACGRGCGSNQPRREGELVGLDDNGIPAASLFMSADVARCT